jgi:hypothetical protein
MTTRGTIPGAVVIVLGALTILAIVAFPPWALLVGMGLMDAPGITASEVYAAIATPYLVLAALWAAFLSMAWATKPVDETKPPTD